MGRLDDMLESGEFARLSPKEQERIYFELAGAEETAELASENSGRVVRYNPNEHFCVADIVARVGDYTPEQLIDEGYSIGVYEENGVPRGAIATMDDGEVRYIGVVAVAEDSEGKGIMGGLVESVSGEKPLTAKVTNTRAREVFERYGFIPGQTENGLTWMVRA